MIHYQLRCEQGHEFDSWFKDSAGFERQAKRGLIECPSCGAVKVERALMAPHVPSKRRRAEPEILPPKPVPVPAAGPDSVPVTAGGRMPDHVRAMLQRMRSEVEKNCDYVGPQFADEARKIHRGESDKRGIYGETTPEQAEKLSEEGIEVSAIPWLPRADS
jgi:hypothetical protein